jgi:hypothetical protein
METSLQICYEHYGSFLYNPQIIRQRFSYKDLGGFYMTASERVILIQGDASKWYDQAIFIVKPNGKAEDAPVDMVAEAEKIINNYLIKNKKPLPAGFPPNSNLSSMGYVPTVATTPKKRTPSKRVDFFLNIIIVLACLAIAGVFMYGMMA